MSSASNQPDPITPTISVVTATTSTFPATPDMMTATKVIPETLLGLRQDIGSAPPKHHDTRPWPGAIPSTFKFRHISGSPKKSSAAPKIADPFQSSLAEHGSGIVTSVQEEPVIPTPPLLVYNLGVADLLSPISVSEPRVLLYFALEDREAAWDKARDALKSARVSLLQAKATYDAAAFDETVTFKAYSEARLNPK